MDKSKGYTDYADIHCKELSEKISEHGLGLILRFPLITG